MMADEDRPILVVRPSLWHCRVVKTLSHRCCVVLGLLAMAVALWAIPASVSFALAKADMAASAGAAEEMPCKGECPDCAKLCPDLSSCLLKGFQLLSAPPPEAKLYEGTVRRFAPVAPPQVMSDALIPPLLRPPSV